MLFCFHTLTTSCFLLYSLFLGMNLVEKFTYKYVVYYSIIISWFTYVRFVVCNKLFIAIRVTCITWFHIVYDWERFDENMNAMVDELVILLVHDKHKMTRLKWLTAQKLYRTSIYFRISSATITNLNWEKRFVYCPRTLFNDFGIFELNPNWTETVYTLGEFGVYSMNTQFNWYSKRMIDWLIILE